MRFDRYTEDHSHTVGQTERFHHVLEDVLRSMCADTPRRWSSTLPVVEFAMNNAVHASTGYICSKCTASPPPRSVNDTTTLFRAWEKKWSIGLLMSALLLFKNRPERSL